MPTATRQKFRYVEAEAVLLQIKKEIRQRNYREAMNLCEHLKCMLSAKKALGDIRW